MPRYSDESREHRCHPAPAHARSPTPPQGHDERDDEQTRFEQEEGNECQREEDPVVAQRPRIEHDNQSNEEKKERSGVRVHRYEQKENPARVEAHNAAECERRSEATSRSDRLEQPEQEREHCAQLGEHQQLINPQVQPNELVARFDRQRQKRPVFDSAAERVANVLPPVPAGRLTQVVVNVNVRPGDGKERDAEDEEACNCPRDRNPGNSGSRVPSHQR